MIFEDQVHGVYEKLVISDDRLVGGILVGDTSDYSRFVQLARTHAPITGALPSLARATEPAELVCSCNNVGVGAIRAAIASGATTVAAIKTCTKAGGLAGCARARDLCRAHRRR